MVHLQHRREILRVSDRCLDVGHVLEFLLREINHFFNKRFLRLILLFRILDLEGLFRHALGSERVLGIVNDVRHSFVELSRNSFRKKVNFVKDLHPEINGN